MAKRKKLIHMLPMEKLGLILSIACAVHCMAMPFFLFFAPYVLSSFAFNELVEWALVSSSFFLAAFLLYLDFKKHRRALPLILLLFAVLSKLIEIIADVRSLNWLFGLLLGIFVALAYWVNYQHKSSCTCKIHE